MYAQSLSLRSEELDADTVYSFVPNIGDSDPSSRCTYSKITNGADVDLNHSFLKQVLRTQLCVHHDAVVIVFWVIWSKCASKRTKMCVMENPVKLMDKKIIAILCKLVLLNWPYGILKSVHAPYMYVYQ